MFSVPRVARLFLIITALLAIPSLYLFYPGPRPAALQKFGWDVGGIDGDHFRTPSEILAANAPQQHHQGHEKTPEEAAVEIEDEEQRALIDGESVNHGSGGEVPEHVGEGGDSKGSGGGAEVDFDHDKHRKVSGGEGEVASGGHVGEHGSEFGKVIMPHLGNATAK